MTNEELLALVGAENNDEFKLRMLEVIGELVLTVHWLRGTFNWMMHTGVVKWPSAQDEVNYKRLFGNIELYESFVWETAPSRAMTVALREYRKTGKIDANVAELLRKDHHGRIPYNTPKDSLVVIKSILGDLAEQRKQREGTTYDDYIDIMRRLGEAEQS